MFSSSIRLPLSLILVKSDSVLIKEQLKIFSFTEDSCNFRGMMKECSCFNLNVISSPLFYRNCWFLLSLSSSCAILWIEDSKFSQKSLNSLKILIAVHCYLRKPRYSFQNPKNMKFFCCEIYRLSYRGWIMLKYRFIFHEYFIVIP